MLQPIVLGREICCDQSSVLDKEWLVTNGIGGYASSTISGANTRRYHGLLVAALRPPLERTILLSKVDEELTIGDRTFYLGTDEYPNDTLHPGGFVHLQEVRFDLGIPTFSFAAGGVILYKTIWMAYGRNTTYVRYSLDPSSAQPAALSLILLANYRDYHGETNGSLEWNFAVSGLDVGCEVRAFAAAAPYRILCYPQAQFVPTGVWYWHFVYRRERERGLRFMEDLYMPGLFRATLKPGESLTLVATAEDPLSLNLDAESSLGEARNRQAGLLRLGEAGLGEASEDPFVAQLMLAADQFVAQRPNAGEHRPSVAGESSSPFSNPDHGKAASEPPYTVLAGYHWFGDWGRDAMIGLPGLALLTGRVAEAKSVLRTFAHYVDRGMIPNRFPDRGETPEYNTVDATLWYFQALQHYLDQTADWTLLEELYPVLTEIVDWHLRGTRYNIKVDADGLLYAGEDGVQLTWMDAKVGDWVVTPRQGKPVEINALWYNALRLMEDWSKRLAQPIGRFATNADLCKESFDKRFWYQTGGYLFDVVDGPEGDDRSFRPNQIFAISLPYPLLERQKAVAVLDAVTVKLLTPRGLRSLAADDPRYVGRYRGDQGARDGAYHQGTVWGWLIGPYFDARLRLHGEVTPVQQYLASFRDHLLEAGIGSISEIFEGDPPHFPCGCIAQAWSVAELLRVWQKVTTWNENNVLSLSPSR